MSGIALAPNETILHRMLAQLSGRRPETVGTLYLTNQRLVLVPNQLLSVGFGRRWELSLDDIASVSSKAPFRGGPYIGMAGYRLVLHLKDGSQRILSTLQSIVAFKAALEAQLRALVASSEGR